LKTILKVFVVVSIAVCSGCIPYRFTARTGVSGTVTDAQTGNGVFQATIALSSRGTTQQPSELVTHSDAYGRYEIPAQRRWGILPIGPLDPARWGTRINVTATGYKSYNESFPCTTVGPSVIKLPDLKLDRITTSTNN
jgi:hypothetical protein